MTRAGLVDEGVVKAFLEYSSIFPVGSLVQLTDRRIGKVISAHPRSFAKPVVSILTDANEIVLHPREIYQEDLRALQGTQIVKALSVDYLKNVGIMDGF
jgi:hypothetical protein